MKYLKTYKQFESGCFIKTEYGEAYDSSDETYPFGRFDGDFKIGEESSIHGEELRSPDMGRLFIEEKVIAFWYDDVKITKKFLHKLQTDFNKQKNYNINIFDGEWRIDYAIGAFEIERIPKEFEKYFTYFSPIEEHSYALIPVDEFIKDELKMKVNPLAREIHLMNVKDKIAAMKKLGIKPKKPVQPKGMSPAEYKFRTTMESSQTLKPKMTNIEYVGVVNDGKMKPILYITEYKMIKLEDNKMIAKIKGYRYMNLSKYGVERFGWVCVNDFNTNRTHEIDVQDFKEGTERKKIYDIVV